MQVTVLSGNQVEHDQVLYTAGQSFDCTDEQAQALVNAGVVSTGNKPASTEQQVATDAEQAGKRGIFK